MRAPRPRKGFPLHFERVEVVIEPEGLPLFRQEGIYVPDGGESDRRLMAQWMGRVGFELEILAAHVLGEILKGPRVFADETRLPILAPGTGAVKKVWLWAYARDDSTFAVAGRPW